jgi:hypothetical protein
MSMTSAPALAEIIACNRTGDVAPFA